MGNLINRVDGARSRLQAANDQLSEVRVILGSRARQPEERGLLDRVWDTVRDHGHTALDIAGLIPIIGAPADGLNAAWYAAEGDLVNAGLSAAGIIPFAGEAATAAKLGNRAVDAVRGADNAIDATRAADTPNVPNGSGGSGDLGGPGGPSGPGGSGGGGNSGPWWEVSNEGPNRQGSRVPESFDLRVNETNYYVHPNATKHMEEYARWSRQETGIADNVQNRTQRHGTGGNGEVPISTLAGAVEQAQVQGLNPGRNFTRIGDWELGIDTNDNVIFHAVYRPSR